MLGGRTGDAARPRERVVGRHQPEVGGWWSRLVLVCGPGERRHGATRVISSKYVAFLHAAG